MILLKLSKWCEILAFKFKSKSIYYELKHYLKRKETYIMHIHYWERGIGKSYNLVKLALQNDMPIIVPNNVMASNLLNIAKKHFHPDKLDVVVATENKLMGREFNGVLLEEEIPLEMLYLIGSHSKFMIGYKFIERY